MYIWKSVDSLHTEWFSFILTADLSKAANKTAEKRKGSTNEQKEEQAVEEIQMLNCDCKQRNPFHTVQQARHLFYEDR